MKRAVAAILMIMTMTVLIATAALGETNVKRILLRDMGAALRDIPAGKKIDSIHGKTWLYVCDELNGWYLVSYNGQNGWVSGKQVAQEDRVQRSSSGRTSSRCSASSEIKSNAKPRTEREEYGLGAHDRIIAWVQTNLKAAGWYQGDPWKVTGCLGKHTMSEIRGFMSYMGNPHHTGVVDQSVIDALCEYLGDRVVHVNPN